MSKVLVKIEVCTSCLSPIIVDPDCICVYQKDYPTIELEFEQCGCCGNTKSHPAFTEFNLAQYKLLDNES